MSLISVIVPVYNVEKVLKHCIDSILGQTYTDFELVLVDDGSPDNSGRICDEYAKKDNRIKVIHKENGGVSSARNTGIRSANGKYICFVDSDDFLEKDYLKHFAEAKQLYPELDNIWCRFKTVKDYKINSNSAATYDERISFYNLSQIMELHQMWLDASPFNKFYSRKVLTDNEISFSEDLSLGEDLIFNFQYLDKTNGKIAVVNKPLYNYIRNGKESLDNKYYPNLLEIYSRITSVMLNYAKKWALSESEVGKIYSASFYQFEKVLKNTFSKNNTDSFLKKIRYNNEILRSNEFRQAINKMDGYIHPLYKTAYKSKNYFLVICVDKFVKIANVIRK